MPNWVYNKLTVAGDKQVLDKFESQASKPARVPGNGGDTDISFLNFIKPEATEMAWYIETGWYDWNISNWGCKWDAGRVEILERSEGKMVYYFETPWSPPHLVFRAMAAQHPALDLLLEYEEEQGWGGELIGKNGEAREGKSWDEPSGLLIS